MTASAVAMALLATLATYLLHSTVTLGLAALVTRRMPRRHDLIADAIWKAAMVVPVLSTAVAAALSRQGIVRTEPVVIPRPEDLLAGGDADVALRVLTGLAACWVVGATLALATLGLRHRHYRSALGRRTPLPDGIARGVRQGLRTARLTASPNCVVPVALGGEVCLPSRLLPTLSTAELRSIVAHELAHERRRDPAWRILGQVLSAIFFFQPLNRLAVGRLAELSEWICDAHAMQGQDGGSALAAALVRVLESAGEGSTHGRLAPSLMHTESLALQRVRAALAGRTPQSPVALRPRFALSAAAALLVVLAWVPRLVIDSTGLVPFTIHARDEAGPFTITINRGTVIGASVQGQVLPAESIVQSGTAVSLVDPRAEPLRLTLRRGGLSWQSRPARPAPANTP